MATGIAGKALLEELISLAAAFGNTLLERRRKTCQSLVGPQHGPIGPDDADPFAESIEDFDGLLGDCGSLQGEKIESLGQNSIKFLLFEKVQRIADRFSTSQIETVRQSLQEAIVSLTSAAEDQQSTLACLLLRHPNYSNPTTWVL